MAGRPSAVLSGAYGATDSFSFFINRAFMSARMQHSGMSPR